MCIPFVGSSYFEDRYRCTLETKSIEVSLSTGQQLCLTYLAGIRDIAMQTRRDIIQANKNLLDSKDKSYRSGVLMDLNADHAVLLQAQDDILTAIQDFEQELFFHVKRLVGYYLKPKYDTLINKLQQAQQLKDRLLVLGNAEQLKIVRNQMDRQEREIMFLETIREAGSFEQLIPILKRRVQLQEGKIE